MIFLSVLCNNLYLVNSTVIFALYQTIYSPDTKSVRYMRVAFQKKISIRGTKKLSFLLIGATSKKTYQIPELCCKKKYTL